MSPVPVGREEVLGALERTLATGAARIEFRHEVDFDFDMADSRSSSVRLRPLVRGLLRRPGRGPLGALLRGIWRLLLSWAGALAWAAVLRLTKRWMAKLGALRAVGVLDFDARRCMYGCPARSEATLVAGDRSWNGTPGTAVGAVAEQPASALQPLWLLDLVGGVEEAHQSGEELLDGHACRRLVVHADLNRAADAVAYEVAVPAGMDQLGQLTRIPAELWIDPQRQIRRIRHRSGDSPKAASTITLDLIEFGVEPPADWSRLDVAVA